MAASVKIALILLNLVFYGATIQAASIPGAGQLECIAHVRKDDEHNVEIVSAGVQQQQHRNTHFTRSVVEDDADDEVIHNPPDVRQKSAEPMKKLYYEPEEKFLFERCTAGQACHTVWTVQKVDNYTADIIEFSGCLQVQEGSCATNTCVSVLHRTPPGKPNSRTQSCCCNTAFCNKNLTVGPEPIPVAVSAPPQVSALAKPVADVVPESPQNNLQTYLICGFLIAGAVLILGGFLMFARRRYRMKAKPPADVEDKGQVELNLSEVFPGRIFPDKAPVVAADVIIQDKLAFGRYGEVFKAKVGEQVVAVKKFTPANREIFLHECRIYNLPHMEDDAILRFLAATEVRDFVSGLISEYWLVVEYHPNRTLMEYLKQGTIDSATLATMALSLASGLSHLHSELVRDGVTKPGIVHRDLNSRNILVREDMRLCICDMGFALMLDVKSDSPEVSQTGSGSRRDEPPPLNDVGTVRYMAPEVLEGSLNLRDSSAALRQVDMYAFALILWEMATRCWDIYQGGPVPEYQLPFQKEAGLKPNFSVMQNLVARRKARPLFSDFWKANSPTVRFLRETMEECWDGDAEARLTVNCVRERLIDLCNSLELHRIHNNLEKVQAPPILPFNAPVEPVEEPTEVAVLLSSIDEHVRPPVKNVNELRDGIMTCMPVPLRVQPHQGRNPCAERNMKPESSEELTASGNTLIGKKTGLRKKPSALPELSAGTRNRLMEDAENDLGRTTTTDGKKKRQKKVPNVLAAEQNRNGFFSFFRKNSDSNNLMKYRAVCLANPAGPSHNPATLPPLTQDAGKCNIQAAAKLLPQPPRRDAAHEGSNTTQLTCLSPSPSTSGATPPRPTAALRPPRFSGLGSAVSGTDMTGSPDGTADLARFTPHPVLT